MNMKSFIAAVLAVSLVGVASATDAVQVKVVRQVNVVRVEQPVKVVREVKVVRVEQPVKIVREVKVVNVQRRAVQVEEVDIVESRRVGPVRAAFRAFFGLDNTVETVRTVRVAR